ncbi:MAG: hypothetical protein QOE98_933 [Gaiellaceae bacterium]|jgi:hypothetical protein|nr:hypothetical protein [Gaiellaceae bacterium]
MFSRKLTTAIAIGAASIAVPIGAYAIDSQSWGNGPSGTANAATSGTANAATPGPNQHVVGQVPPNWSSGSGTIITGAAADEAQAVAVAQYPGGTVNRVLQLSDGSYAVHLIKISWPHHVFVSKDFQVTGAIG